MSLKERVDESVGKRKPAEVQYLELDGSPSSNGQVEGLTEEFEGLERLSMLGCNISSLKGFPKLHNLKKLDLSDNRLVGGFEPLVEACPNLIDLRLAGNKIKEADALQPLTKLKSLQMLELFNCDITDDENYRETVFKLLPDLLFLDGKDREGEDANLEDDDDYYEGDDDDDEDDLGEGDGEEEDDEEYDGEGAEEEDGEDEEDGEEEDGDGEAEEPRSRGKKRKHDEEDEPEDEEDD